MPAIFAPRFGLIVGSPLYPFLRAAARGKKKPRGVRGLVIWTASRSRRGRLGSVVGLALSRYRSRGSSASRIFRRLVGAVAAFAAFAAVAAGIAVAGGAA